ncbi:hypothetical protein Fmac_013149 [Flemingia macrophylla]|uniref:Uncharacterized protein n=1 Tax=Flemingia macrophylla TaxID=520843 RepID=A0ABD1MT87_9FABA
MEILDEFRPLMPLRTVRSSLSQASKEDQQECHTPTTSSPPPTLLCPPPPKKPRLSSTQTHFPSQPFFQVPHDLASVFLLRSNINV